MGTQKKGEPEKKIMKPEAHLNEAGKAVMHQRFRKLQKAREEIEKDQSPTGVHNMRVAARRLLAELDLMQKAFPGQEKNGDYRYSLRNLAGTLGKTRDLDVFLENLEKYSSGLPVEEKNNLEVLKFRLLKKREKTFDELLTQLSNPKTRKFLDGLQNALKPGAKDLTEAKQGKVKPEEVRHLAGSAIWRSYEEVLAFQPHIKEGQPVLHRLRSACKRLRYTLEFFEEALGTETKTFITQLTGVQDVIGEWHDHIVARKKIGKLLTNHPGNEALKNYAAFREAEQESLQTEFFKKWWPILTGNELRDGLANNLVKLVEVG